jgi:RNA 2',3'-cyclic 3'-phosphodiesterase
VRGALGAAGDGLRVVAPRADVRWVAATAMHLTLKFLGGVPEEQVAALRDSLAAVAATTPPMTLTCAGLGVFPGPSRPRVVWAGITDGLRELGSLTAAVERAVEPLGYAPERRPFRGHVTLGRVRSPRGFGPLARAIEHGGRAGFGAWKVAHVVLYRSHLRSTGSVYEPLATLPLGGAVA